MLPILHGIVLQVVSDVTFLFRDDFTTDESAPIASPRTAEPGPGTWTVTDGTEIASVASGNLVINGTPAANSGLVAESISRSSGLALLFDCVSVTANVGYNTTLGFAATATPVTANNNTSGIWLPNNASGQTPLLINSNYNVLGLPNISGKSGAIILRDSGFFFVLDGKLEYVVNAENNATVYPALYFNGNGSQARVFSFDYIRVSQLPAPFDTDYGIATGGPTGAVTAATTFTHEADCLIEFVVDTLPSSGGIKCIFRMQDSSNYWYVNISASGNFDLYEYVSGSTVRGSAAGVISDGERIVIIADDDEIRGYADNTLAWTYSSATNFKTETAGELNALGTGGAVSDLVTWPRTLSGAAKAALDAVADA